MPNLCPLCERLSKPASEFCLFHDAARANLDVAYIMWCNSFGGELTKEEYYAKLEKRDETGATVKAVMHYFAKGSPP